MIEENFEIWQSEMPQIDSILPLLYPTFSPWLKKILKFDLKILKAETFCKATDWLNFTIFWQSLFHLGLRKFWNLIFWKSIDRLMFTTFTFWQSLFHHGWRNFWNLIFWKAAYRLVFYSKGMRVCCACYLVILHNTKCWL